MNSSAILLLSLFVISLWDQHSCYKILIFSPKVGRSHVLFMGRIGDILTERGHDVTIVLPNLNVQLIDNGAKLAKMIVVPPHPEVTQILSAPLVAQQMWNQKGQSIFGIFNLTRSMAKAFTIACEHFINQTSLVKQLKDENFDLAITEIFDTCPIGLIELLKIDKYLLVSASGIFESIGELLGLPIFPSYIPCAMSSSTDQMTYYERAINLMSMIVSKNMFISDFIAKEEALFRRLFGNDFINFNEKISNTSFFLTNTDPFFDFVKPTIPKVVEIGGFTIPDVKPLDEYWTNILSLRRKTILISFGSWIMSHLMPDEMKTAILQTIDQFPDVTFIWKYEKEEHKIADGHPNLITSKWVPQTDLLAHPNLSAFLTHGGMNSITETINRGKPIIVLPIFGDQIRNAILAVRSGCGIWLNISDVTKDGKLRDAFKAIINEKIYAENAKKMSRMLAKRPNNAKMQLIKHVEFAAKFGTLPNFDPYGRHMSYFVYFSLDIIIPFILLVIMFMFGTTYILYKVVRLFLMNKERAKIE